MIEYNDVSVPICTMYLTYMHSCDRNRIPPLDLQKDELLSTTSKSEEEKQKTQDDKDRGSRPGVSRHRLSS